VKGDTLYAFALRWPADGRLAIKTLARESGHYPREIGRIELVGHGAAPLPFTRTAEALAVTLPPTPTRFVATLKISPR